MGKNMPNDTPVLETTLVAFLFKDVEHKLQVLNLSPDYQLHEDEVGGFTLTQRRSVLPENFFGPSISTVSALIGRNSSGKSTVLADIARVLCGKPTISAGCSLIVKRGDRFVQLRSALRVRIAFGDEEIEAEKAGKLEGLKVAYYSSSFDPLQRHGALLESETPVRFIDMSNQTIYSSTGLLHQDFDTKLAYLERIGDSMPLELSAEGQRTRFIAFTAALDYDPVDCAREFLEFMLDKLPETFVESIKEALRIAFKTPDETFSAEPPVFGGVREALRQPRRDYFRIMRGVMRDQLGLHRMTEDPVVLLLAVGRLAALLKMDRGRFRLSQTVAQLSRLATEPDDVLATLLGADFFDHAEVIARHAVRDRRRRVPVSADFGAGMPYLRFRIDGASARPGRKKKPAPDRPYRELLQAFIAMRHKQIPFVVEFSGLSDGQRSLLTFAARYARQEAAQPWIGTTVLLLDEHEQGLHPEWQRHFIKRLCGLVAAGTRSKGRTQVLLSSHSPFVVSDLPAACVNIVGAPAQAPAGERTFGANLLELLVSPLFMDRTTGEFAVDKVRQWLADIEAAQNRQALERIRPLFDLVGDKLMRNYLHLKWNERLASVPVLDLEVRHD